MVMKPEPLIAAIRAAHARLPPGSPRMYLSAQGERFTQARAQELALLPGVLLVAGRYEGVDERVVEAGDRPRVVGRRLCALRRGVAGAGGDRCAGAAACPGRSGDERSSVEDSFVQGLLDWPHYTRPEVFEGRSVPPVLLSGDHAEIRRWRLEQAFARTVERRPDMLVAGETCAARRGALWMNSSPHVRQETKIEVNDHEQDHSGNQQGAHDPRSCRTSSPATPWSCRSRWSKAIASACRPTKASSSP